ncbi:MAG: UDP-N-acetylmuramoyl-tripeptide--D-alanyl-D-alanine ligase [Bacteroidales bacterium]
MIENLYQLFQVCSCVTTDSRNCPKDSMFIALKGANFNGNAFASKALEAGCKYVVIDEAAYLPAGDPRYVLVDDCLRTLQQLANFHRRQLGKTEANPHGIPVIGITGTNGKTTTKELTAAVLSKKYNVLYTQGNLNNSIGVPLTVLRLKPEHDIAIVEMGASHPGDIQELVGVCEPNIGLITNVGRAHLQGFGSFEGVKRTKGELYDFIKATDGELIVNADSDDLMQMVQERGITRLTFYGERSPLARVKGQVVDHTAMLHFQWTENNFQSSIVNSQSSIVNCQSSIVNSQLIGTYNLPNMLAAITIGLKFGVAVSDINAALENYEPHNNRSQLTKTERNTLIVDAYNANPTSMQAALDNFHNIEADNKMLILGEMRELGEDSLNEHRKIVKLIHDYGFQDVVLVGEEFIKTGTSFPCYPDVNALTEVIKSNPPQSKTILIKGSNGTKLFTLPELL